MSRLQAEFDQATGIPGPATGKPPQPVDRLGFPYGRRREPACELTDLSRGPRFHRDPQSHAILEARMVAQSVQSSRGDEQHQSAAGRLGPVGHPSDHSSHFRARRIDMIEDQLR